MSDQELLAEVARTIEFACLNPGYARDAAMALLRSYHLEKKS